MAANRVIGKGGRMPWHLPDDFKWFKQTTLGHIVLMGRKTFESLGRPLPGRENIVLTHGRAIAGVRTIHSISELSEFKEDQREIFLIGGAQLYEQLLPQCEELLLSRLHQAVEGDAFFPPFEHLFEKVETLHIFPEFVIERYLRKSSSGEK